MAVVRAANGVSAAAVASNPNDANGAAGDTDWNVQILDDDTQEGEDSSSTLRVGLGIRIQSITGYAREWTMERTVWTLLQHWTGPVLHWLAGIPPRASRGVAAARRGRANAVKAATRENMIGW